MEKYTDVIIKELNMTTPSMQAMNVPTETITELSRMFIYLFSCPSKDLLTWKSFLTKLMKSSTPKMMIMTLNRLLVIFKTSENRKVRIIETLLDKIKGILNLDFKNLIR